MKFKSIKLAVSLALAVPALSMAAADTDSAVADKNNWAHPRGNYSNHGYSQLSQINQANVKNVKAAWTFATGVNRGHEGSPLVIGNMMYVHTAFPNNVYALDLNDNQKSFGHISLNKTHQYKLYCAVTTFHVV